VILVREPSATGEVVLRGGLTNAGRVTRVGNTVRRPLRPTSASTHALLDHLDAVGFDGAPRALGTDDRGREVLSYIPGEAVYPPYPEWALTDDALVSVALLLRRFHEAAAGFDPSGHDWPEQVPAAFRDGPVSHNDPNLDNVVFQDGRAVALIDFDLAAPGSVVWDVACAARLWAPLREERDQPERLRGRGLARLRLFADAYGLTTAERRRVVEALPQTQAWAYAIVRRAIDDGHETFERMWADGGADRADRTQTWLREHGLQARAALES
jgi:hypothetical protein